MLGFEFQEIKRISIFFEGSLWERLIINRTHRSSLKRYVKVSFCEIGITAFGMECKICDCKSQFQLCISGKKSNSAYHKVVCVIFLTKNELVGTNKKTIICCFLLPVWPASVRARKLDFPLWLSGTRNGNIYIRDFTALLCRVDVLA